MHEDLDADIRLYWKKYAHATVEAAQAKYARLADCVVVLTPGEGAPRLVKRSEAPARLKKHGYPSSLFECDLGTIDEPDELCLVWKGDDVLGAHKLRVGRGAEDPARPMALPPFTPPAKVDAGWLDGVAGTIAGLQERACEMIAATADEPGEFMIFWPLLSASPTLIVREGAKATLGKHRRWKEILCHVYTPCADVLALVELNGKLVPFVRKSKG
jgi:hypothetical protein